MTSKSSICAICDVRNMSKKSVIWCPECDEGLCLDCQDHHSISKATKKHSTIPISEYQKLPKELLQIAQFCSSHHEKYQLFCTKHDSPCCIKCVTEKHTKCKDVVPIDEITKSGVKTSTAFMEVERTLTELVGNIDKIYQDRQTNLLTVKEQSKKIEKEIKETKKNISKHLDKIEEDLINELNKTTDKEGEKIRQSLNLLDQKRTETENFKKSIDVIKHHASDLQAFLVMKKLEKDIPDQSEFLEKCMESDEFNKTAVISCAFDSTLMKFTDVIKRFGTLNIQKRTSEVMLTRQIVKQAQIIVAPPRRSITGIKLKLEKKLDIMSSVTGCTMLPDGKMVFVSSNLSGTLTIVNDNGSVDYKMEHGAGIFDVGYIQDSDAFIITFGPSVEIFDMKEKKVKNIYEAQRTVWGVAVGENGEIYTPSDIDILKINLKQDSVATLMEREESWRSYIATFQGNIYYTNINSHAVICCDLQGVVRWEFKDENVLKCPLGISVDSHGNVYVVGGKSNNVVIVSSDGKNHMQILSKEDGIARPWALHISCEHDILLLTDICHAFCFKIIQA